MIAIKYKGKYYEQQQNSAKKTVQEYFYITKGNVFCLLIDTTPLYKLYNLSDKTES